MSVFWARALEYLLIASERPKVDTLKQLPQGDAGNVLCATVPPLPTYNIVGEQGDDLVCWKAGRFFNGSWTRGDGISPEREKSPKISTDKKKR